MKARKGVFKDEGISLDTMGDGGIDGYRLIITGVTCSFSTVDGTAFVDRGNLYLPRYVGKKLTFTDTAGKTRVGFVKAGGTGETLSVTEKFTDPVFDVDGAWTKGDGWAVASGKGTATTSTANITESIALIAGGLYKLVLTSSGTITGTYQGIIEANDIGTVVNTVGATNWYRTVQAADAATAGINGVTSLTGSFTDASLKQVTAPSWVGCTIVTESGGTTYNWTSVDAGFNDHDTYTVTVSDS